MSFTMELDENISPPLLRLQIGEDFTGDDFDNWIAEYDRIMSAQTTMTNVIVDTSQSKKVHNAIRRMFSKMNFPAKYPYLDWTVIWGESRIIATTVRFLAIANKNLKMNYSATEEDALSFLSNLPKS